jgi:hypothetical protein
MKNVTITLEPVVARWVRIKAAEREMSVSRFVGEMLKQRMEENDGYQCAMREYLALEPKAVGSSEEPLPKREALYDRAVLR